METRGNSANSARGVTSPYSGAAPGGDPPAQRRYWPSE